MGQTRIPRSSLSIPVVLLLLLVWIPVAQAEYPLMDTATTDPPCHELWPISCVYTDGGIGAPAHDYKVHHMITGHIIFPEGIDMSENRIPVCAGTDVTAIVVDISSDTPDTHIYARSRGIECSNNICDVFNIQRNQYYTAQSGDHKDTDLIMLVPE